MNSVGLVALATTHAAMAKFIAAGNVAACHDVSDGGIAVAAAEMCIASGLGFNFDPDVLLTLDAFAEIPGRYLIELKGSAPAIAQSTPLKQHFPPGTKLVRLGLVQHGGRLTIFNQETLKRDQRLTEMLSVEEMTAAWRGTLDW